jgi:hypothetical protein
MVNEHKIVLKLLFIVSISFLVSCQASIKVYVDSFDTIALRETYAYRQSKVVKYKRALTTEFTKSALDIYKTKITKPWIDFIDNPEMHKVPMALDVKDALKRSISDTISKYIDAAYENYHKALENLVQYQVTRTPFFWDKVEQYVFDGNEMLTTLKIEMDAFSNYMQSAKMKMSKVNEFKEIVKKSKDSVKDKQTSFGKSITGDDLASLVVRAPKSYWKKMKNNVNIIEYDGHNTSTRTKRGKNARLNKSIARAFMGNVDVAIKMEEPGSYVVKGVRLDADAVLSASSRVVSQAIKYMAISQGLGGLIPDLTNKASGKASQVLDPLKTTGLIEDNIRLLDAEYKLITKEMLKAMLPYKKVKKLNDNQQEDVARILTNYKTKLEQLTKKYQL